jgi:amino acid adenylation domain-containing protein
MTGAASMSGVAASVASASEASTSELSTGETAAHSLSDDQARLLNLLLEERARAKARITPFPREHRDRPVRLLTSWAQQRLWFIDQLEGGTAAYHIAVGVRLRGVLNEPALRASLDAIVQRHESLRTVFVAADGQPLQEIAPTGSFLLQTTDLRAIDEAERHSRVEAQKYEALHQPFDLRTGPLIRGRLLRLTADEHLLLVTMHHIVSDGWSMGVFFAELAALYASHQSGRQDPLQPLAIQYADYAQWQRAWLHGEERDRQLNYWRTHLIGAPPALALPTDRPRPAVQSFRGGNVPVVLDAALSADLKNLAQRHEMTLFMVLYAGWAILLSRLSGQDEVVIGTPVANRRQRELEPLIGFFVNTLALRVGVPGDQRVEELLHQIKHVTLSAYEHQDVPFERVVEALAPDRSLSRNPIFQVMLALQSAPNRAPPLPDLTVSAEPGIDEPAMFDLLLSLEERGDEIVGSLNYAQDLFDRGTVTRWLASFDVLLRAMTRAPQTEVGALPWLTDAERERVLTLFNKTRVVFPHDQLVHESFEAQAARTPEAEAVRFGEQACTYAELNTQANRLAHVLRARGVGPGRLVGLCAERGIPMVIGVLAILKAGGAYLPLDPSYPTERLAYMLTDAAPAVVLTQAALHRRLPKTGARLLLLDELLEPAPGESQAAANNLPASTLGLRPEHLVYTIYTSGSTGQPKGTAMTHRAMGNLLAWHHQSFPGGEGVRVMQFAALSFDVAFQELFTTLSAGGTLVLLEEWVRRDARALAELIRAQSIERLFLPPLMLQSVAESLASGEQDVPSNLRDVICAGEQLRISAEIRALFARCPGARLHNHYGPTETHVVTASTLEGDPQEWPDLPPIGRPIANTQVYVLDARRQPVPIGVAGELYLGGANLARGYLHRPELTAERFVADPFSTDPRARLYKTGDLGRWRSDGTLEYLGRNDDQVKIRGFRVELGEIEAQLAGHAHVQEVAVVAREEPTGPRRLVAYVTARAGGAPSAEALRAHLQGRLPEHMIPSAFVTLEQLPRTPSGKLDRRALPAPDVDAYVTRTYEPPQGEIEEILAGVWQELLHVKRVGRHDNFFELGGHSLLATRVFSHISYVLDVDLPIRLMFERPTIDALSRCIEKEIASQSFLEEAS